MPSRSAHVIAHVDDYLHDLLDADAADHVARHCAACPACAAALDEARRRLAALEALPPSEASESLVRETVAAVDAHECRRRWRRRSVLGSVLGVAAAAAAVIAVFHIHYANLRATPTDLKVLGQRQLLAGAAGSLRVCLLDHRTGLALSGVHVRIDLQRKATGEVVELAHFTTDAQGTGQPRFQVPDWGNADCELHVTAVGAPSESVSYPVKLRRERQVMLSCDKPVYQPGQTIRVRSLALRRPDLRPVAGEEATFTVTDPKGNVIFKQAGKSSAYGIASADCPLADEIIEGQYVIDGTVGDTSSRLAVEVKKYVLPKFKVGVTLDRPYYTPGQKVTATVDAAYFFGQAVAGAVEIEARVSGQEKPLYQAGVKADANGRAVFSFVLPNDLARQSGGDVSLRVAGAVTDTAGHQERKEIATIVTASPLRVEAFAENGTLVAGAVNKVYVFTTYADGRPARTRLSGLVPVQDAALRTNEVGVLEFLFNAGGDGLDVTLTAEDDAGLRADTKVRIPCGQVGQDFLLRTDKATYDGGDTIALTVLGAGREPVFVDLVRDGQTLLTDTITVANGQGELHIDLPPDLSGTLQLCAYRVAPDQVPVSKLRTVHVRPAGSLRIKTTTDRPEYRPGGRANVKFELLDQAGRPVRGALSLAAVDEAVFSVLPQAPGSEARFFGVEPRFLRPDLTAKLPPAERERLEQALLARASRTVSTGGRKAFSQTGGLAVPDEVAQPEIPVDPPHTLSTSSFTAKYQAIEQARSRGYDRVSALWLFWGLGVLAAAYILMWVYVRSVPVLTALHVAALFVLCGGLIVFVGLFGPMGMMDRMAAKSGAAAPDAAAQAGFDGGTGSARVRQDFPETLLWRPEVITDNDGRVSLEIPLADSITTWRLSASAVAADGRLGAAEAGLKVFQPFFVELDLPVSLTRGDEVTLPVVVYNYLNRPQTVELTLAAGDWFEPLGDAGQRIELAPHAVRSTSYRIRAKKVGKHALQVTAKGGDLADAVRREIEVVPDGRRVEEVANGSLAQPAEMTLTVPDNAIEGSARAFVKIYPSGFSQLVEGLDGIFQMPYGCFEQTSSTTYPNVMALEYLRQTGRAAPDVEQKAKRYIHLGYQRLLGFEVAGGGFDWYGRGPANLRLTAYGLMEFQDMARVYGVDPRLIERTRTWLLSKRGTDGSWSLAGRARDDEQLGTTAYVAWAVFAEPGATSQAELTRSFLLAHKAESLSDPYLIALVANALNAIDPQGGDAQPYLDRLEALKSAAAEGRQCFWEQPAGARTAFYGAGRGGSVETTALATLAMLRRNQYPETTRRALAWLVKQKDAAGTWRSTQATVLALKALVAGTGKPAGDGERRVELVWNGEKQEVIIPKDQAEVMKQIDLSAGLKPGTHRLTLTETSGTAAAFQVAFRYHVPRAAGPEKPEALGVRLAYDRTEVNVDETVRATATVSNPGKAAAPMVVVELPVPAGFAFEADGLALLLRDQKIDRYELTGRGVVVYLRELAAGRSLELKYGLRATLPVKVSVPPARAYEYYDPDKQGTSAAAQLTAASR
jgi:uncharacterized repeat protein (TIGR01451 family)